MSKKKSRKSKYFRILGYRVRRKRFYGVAAFILLPPALFLLVTFTFLQGSRGKDVSTSPIPETEVVEEERVVHENELVALLIRHRQATGLEDIDGMTLYGSYHEGDKDYKMALSMRTPGLIRKKLRNLTLEIVLVAAGGSGQVRTIEANGESKVEAMNGGDLYRNALLLEGSGLRLSDEAERGYTYELLPAEEGAKVRRIISTGLSGISITHVIDLDSSLEVQRSIEVQEGGKSNELKLYMEDTREVDGVALPYHYRLHINNKEAAEIRVQSVQLNPIVPQWFFALEAEDSSK